MLAALDLFMHCTTEKQVYQEQGVDIVHVGALVFVKMTTTSSVACDLIPHS